MQVREIIEDMVVREVKGLCMRCVYASTCIYFRTATREIMQCELFETDAEYQPDSSRGLCKMCDHAHTCKLPGRKEGVWHCDEFL